MSYIVIMPLIDSSVVNLEGHQEGAVRGYNLKKPGSHCYNTQFAFSDEIKAYITGFVRSGNTYTANPQRGIGAGKMDFANGTEYRQQIKTFHLKYIFLAGKIIRMAKSVVLTLSKNYLLSRDLCKKPSLKKLPFSCFKPLFPFKLNLK